MEYEEKSQIPVDLLGDGARAVLKVIAYLKSLGENEVAISTRGDEISKGAIKKSLRNNT